MIEPDRWIIKYASLLGVAPELVGPASVDVRLGGHIIDHKVPEPGVWRLGGDEQEYQLEVGETFTFLPGHFYLAHTLETLTIPVTHAAQLILKSSSGRKGLDHAHSGWIDPGFVGAVTFEFVSHKPVSFQIGQRIAQVIYYQMASVPLKPYGSDSSSHYQNQQGATRAWDK